MFTVIQAGDSSVWEMAVHLVVAVEVFECVLFVLSFFPRDVLDEIWDLIESVSELFPTYSNALVGDSRTGKGLVWRHLFPLKITFILHSAKIRQPEYAKVSKL